MWQSFHLLSFVALLLLLCLAELGEIMDNYGLVSLLIFVQIGEWNKSKVQITTDLALKARF